MSLSQEQQQIADNICKNPAPITFIQGKAGSGKSYLVKAMLPRLNNVKILCPTNMAIKIYGGRIATTMHSFFFNEFDGIDEGYQNPDEYTSVRNEAFFDKIENVDMLIIDEVSMVRSDTMEMIHKICSVARGNNAPFGGIKVVLIGDLFQLPPVVEEKETFDYLKNEYGGIYFFDSHVVKNNLSTMDFYELQQSQRQKNDQRWASILDSLREKPTVANILPVLDKINTRIVPKNAIPDNITTITPSNAEALRINKEKLEAISGQEYTQKAHFKIKELNSDNYKEFYYDENIVLDPKVYHSIVVPSKFEPVLTYKKGALVMFTSGVKPAKNGDFGIIKDKVGDIVMIELLKGSLGNWQRTGDVVSVPMTRDSKYEMIYNSKIHELYRKTPAYQITKQYPFKIGYAFTIHKSQGQTFDQVYLDLESNIFAPGQLYVALSRVKSLDGLYLTSPVAFSDIIVDDRIIEFLNKQRGITAPAQPTAVASALANMSMLDILHKFYQEAQSRQNDNDANIVICKSLQCAEYLYGSNAFPIAYVEIKKICSTISDIFNVSEPNDHIAVRTIATTKFSNADEQSCNSALATLYDLYVRICENPRAIVTDNRHVI